ncbi:hypothetical protein A2U01_0074725, partial [Trifolium medium]|nr:hypothetical protein [Trifolium medium]
EESETQNSGDARDSEELGDFWLVVSEELERSCMLQGEDHGGYTLVETQFKVESFDSGTKGRQSTLAFGYLMGDKDESDIVGPKGCDHEDLVGYVSI